ncbi:hypothetical protein F4805DRAFT_420230 [Annulohypoxylon moriforme]|nr:hypothetical protein F4805DRAFT_420230 [Annulohypoxylon moriforme]
MRIFSPRSSRRIQHECSFLGGHRSNSSISRPIVFSAWMLMLVQYLAVWRNGYLVRLVALVSFFGSVPLVSRDDRSRLLPGSGLVVLGGVRKAMSKIRNM